MQNKHYPLPSMLNVIRRALGINYSLSHRGSWTRVLENDISYSGEFNDENFVPECKKYHTLAHKFKNLFLPRPIDK